jgi:hypothetical protein
MRSRSRAQAAALIAMALVFPAANGSADDHARDPVPFGPFASGDERVVKRHGKQVKSRRLHPMVGRADKVPGEGPPPPPLKSDPDVPEDALTNVNDVGSGMSSNPLYLAALVYRHQLTKLDGPRCQHLPTCSRFANQAVAKHGALGILMGLDRLIRPGESSAIRSMPQVEGWGGVRFLDPVENYEFWVEGYESGMPPLIDEEPLLLDIASKDPASSDTASSDAASSDAASSDAAASDAVDDAPVPSTGD